MRPFVWGILVFGILVVIHLMMWRIRRPSGQYVGLMLLSGIIGSVFIGFFLWAGRFHPKLSLLLPTTLFELFSFLSLYAVLVLAHISTYSAIQADSPTFSILLLVHQTGGSGITRQELESILGDELLVVPRLNDLVSGGLAKIEGARYVIQPRGIMMARPHIYFRGFLKLEKGG